MKQKINKGSPHGNLRMLRGQAKSSGWVGDAALLEDVSTTNADAVAPWHVLEDVKRPWPRKKLRAEVVNWMTHNHLIRGPTDIVSVEAFTVVLTLCQLHIVRLRELNAPIRKKASDTDAAHARRLKVRAADIAEASQALLSAYEKGQKVLGWLNLKGAREMHPGPDISEMALREFESDPNEKYQTKSQLNEAALREFE